VRPFLLENGDQNQVEFVQEGALSSKLLFGSGIFNDEVNDEVANAWRRSSWVSAYSFSSCF
jgi:hypothetical protein